MKPLPLIRIGEQVRQILYVDQAGNGPVIVTLRPVQDERWPIIRQILNGIYSRERNHANNGR